MQQKAQLTLKLEMVNFRGSDQKNMFEGEGRDEVLGNLISNFVIGVLSIFGKCMFKISYLSRSHEILIEDTW